MSDLGELQIDDLERLAIELRMITKDSGEWAEKAGFPEDLLTEVGTVGIRSLMAKIRGEVDFDEDVEEIDGEEMVSVKVDIAQVVGGCCVAAFILGFETHKQYGNA